MRGGLFEATLFFDELTTEVIADGRHLSDELLRLAFKVKGPDSLALVTDANRAMNMPDGEYIFGNKDEGCTILKQNEVGLMPDGKALASSVAGMDHCVRVMRLATKAPLPQIIRMASLTPAKIAGFEKTLGSIAPGKVANLLILDQDLQISRIFLKGSPAE
jgi:N-acetylglucosamine-6-phosphate deacetylase